MCVSGSDPSNKQLALVFGLYYEVRRRIHFKDGRTAHKFQSSHRMIQLIVVHDFAIAQMFSGSNIHC